MEFKLYIVLLSIVSGLSCAQLIIPKRPLGYVYSGSRDGPVHLDAHFGPLCPDSADAFPSLKQVANHYGANNFILVLHMFPLPYHQQSFLVAKGAQIVKKLGSGDATAYSWFQYFYENLDKFSNTNTANMTTNDVIAELSDVAAMLGVQKTAFVQALVADDINLNTRAAWKYSCTRGIASTPTFLLNDIIVEAQSTWTLSDWKQVIDPLMVGLNTTDTSSVSSAQTGACPSGTVECTYLPGKSECCLKGESCIPNVGCRCLSNPC